MKLDDYNNILGTALKSNTVSGTRKRESQSEAFTNAPFDYSFAPIPLSDDGGIFYRQSFDTVLREQKLR